MPFPDGWKPDDKPIVARPALEIQRAHDVIAMAGEELEQRGHPEFVLNVLQNLLDVLCWALNHRESNRFEELLQSMEQMLNDYGIEIWDSGRPHVRDQKARSS